MNNLIAYTNMYLAETINLQTDDKIGSAVGDLKVEDLVSGFLKLILVVAAIVFFFILVVGGVKWIMSGGDKAHTEGARNQITAALVGLVIVFAAWAIAALVGTFFNINIFQLDIPQL